MAYLEHIHTLVEFLQVNINNCDWDIMYPQCPKQSNGFDCGVFMLLYADHLSNNLQLNFTQDDIYKYCWRKKIGICILKNMKKVSIFI
jgi:Ulp1 family protease